MKPKIKWGLIAAIPVAIFLALGRRLGATLELSGLFYHLFWTGFALLGLVVGAAVLWFMGRLRSAREGKPPEPLEEDLTARLAELHDRLMAGGRWSFDRLPAVLILGPPGSGKSSAVLGSALAAEQLTGERARGDAIASTRSINAWYSDGTVLLEAGSDLRETAAAWKRFLERLRPRRLLAAIVAGEAQAPRAVVVCFSCAELTGEGATERVVESARSLRSSLLEVCDTLGIRVPLYVLFTKADEIPSFSEYAGESSDSADRQVLGVTLPPPSSYEAASYVERQLALVTRSFDLLFRSLAHKRLKFMSPDLDAGRAGSVYEFPREFRKISDPAARFLVELSRPSQLGLSPFLRGFYYIGRESVALTQDVAPAPERVEPAIPAGGATQVFDPARLSPRSEVPVIQARTRRDATHRWLFLPRVFRDVILGDDIGRAMMRRGQRISLGRRLLLGSSLFAVVFVLLPWLLVAFSASRGRQQGVDGALQDLRLGATAALPPGDLLRRLDVVRGKADTLHTELAGVGLFRTIRWLGLHPGSGLYPGVVENYFLRFEPLLLRPALESVEAELAALPEVPTESSDYQRSYNLLRAYLMSTRHPDRGEAEFLADVLTRHWAPARDQDAIDLARAQYEFFGRNLRRDGRVTLPQADGPVVARARRFLGRLGGVQPFYLSLVYRADQLFRPVGFRASRSSFRALVTPVEIGGAFSSEGRAFVKGLLSTPDSLPVAEEWVLGGGAAPELAPMVAAMDSLYEADFSERWEEILLSTTVAPFQDPGDAARKLDELAGGGSLLGLIQPIYETAEEMPEPLRTRFRPLRSFLALDSLGEIEGPSEPSTRYLVALERLGRAMADLAQAPAEDRVALAEQIRRGDALPEGEDAVEELEREMAATGQGRPLAAHLSTLLRRPLQQSVQLLGRVGPGVIATWNREFCAQYNARTGSKYPFRRGSSEQASLDDLLEVFKPDGSLLSDHLARLGPYITRQGARYRSASGEVRIGEDFLAFLSRAQRFSEAIFAPGAETPGVRFNLLPKPAQSDRRIQAIIITTRTGRQECTRTDCRTLAGIAWDGSADGELSMSVRLEGVSRPEPVTDLHRGPWAPFGFFAGTSGWGGPEERAHLVRWPVPGLDGQVAVEVTEISPRSVWVFDPGIVRGLRCVE